MSNVFLEKFNKCQICGELNPPDSHFWSNHKIKQSDYFQKYFPKKNLLTGEPITFKTKEGYILNDFDNKPQLKEYFRLNSKENNKNYIKDYLLRRKTLKNLEYSPSQFEIKSLIIPPVSYIEKQYGKNTYPKISQEIGLKNRYDYSQDLTFNNRQLNFITDTREQSVIDLPNITIKKLNYGDYTIEGSDIFIEKKSLYDFAGTISAGYERFDREIQRVITDNSYLIILIEASFADILSINTLPQYRKIKAKPEFLLHRCRELCNKYPNNIQFLAVDGRKEAIKIIPKIFQLNNNIRTVDIQFSYDTGILV